MKNIVFEIPQRAHKMTADIGCSCASCRRGIELLTNTTVIIILLSSRHSTVDVPGLLVLRLLCQGLVWQLYEEHHNAAGEEI